MDKKKLKQGWLNPNSWEEGKGKERVQIIADR